jgi:hypothetical protein
MNHLPILASSVNEISHSHAVSDALPHLLGMLLVMLTLAALWGVCALSATLIKTLIPEKPPKPPVKTTPAVRNPVTTGIPPEIVAVITAAVASVTGPSHRIVSVKPQSSSWAKAGRQSVLSSHRIR